MTTGYHQSNNITTQPHLVTKRESCVKEFLGRVESNDLKDWELNFLCSED